jgi:hypothetical protein
MSTRLTFDDISPEDPVFGIEGLRMSFGPIQVLGEVVISLRTRILSTKVKIHSANISTLDVAAMREADSAWPATVTNPAVVGQVSVRAFATLLAGKDPGPLSSFRRVDQRHLKDADIRNMEELSSKLPQFALAVAASMPLPNKMSRWVPLRAHRGRLGAAFHIPRCNDAIRLEAIR